MGTLSGEVTHLPICFPSQEWCFLKGKNLLLLEQIIFYKSKFQFGRATSAREANRKSRQLIPIVKMTENMEA